MSTRKFYNSGMPELDIDANGCVLLGIMLLGNDYEFDPRHSSIADVLPCELQSEGYSTLAIHGWIERVDGLPVAMRLPDVTYPNLNGGMLRGAAIFALNKMSGDPFSKRLIVFIDQGERKLENTRLLLTFGNGFGMRSQRLAPALSGD